MLSELIPDSQDGNALGLFVLPTEEAGSNVLVLEWDFEIVVSVVEMGTVSETVSVFRDSSLGRLLSAEDEVCSDDGSQVLVSVDLLVPVVAGLAASVSMGSNSSSIGSLIVLVLSSAETVESLFLYE